MGLWARLSWWPRNPSSWWRSLLYLLPPVQTSLHCFMGLIRSWSIVSLMFPLSQGLIGPPWDHRPRLANQLNRTMGLLDGLNYCLADASGRQAAGLKCFVQDMLVSWPGCLFRMSKLNIFQTFREEGNSYVGQSPSHCQFLRWMIRVHPSPWW